MLRGVNLAGSSKLPAGPFGPTHVREGFFDHRAVSFVGRPFPLEEADEHFRRLRAWGFTFLRLLVTWEAVEHAGPGIYDEEYLRYLHDIVVKAGEYGISLFVDPHQDVWSRFSGGDGAPGWTLEAAGFDVTHFVETGAAIVHATHGDPFPKMIWYTNAAKLAAATMFTLFFGGNDFAPQTRIEGEPAQEYLQRHYFGAMQQVAAALCDLPSVVGYDTMNEPLRGYLGYKDLSELNGLVSLGESPTPFQSMVLGEGVPQEVWSWRTGWVRVVKDGKRWVNQQRERAWLPGRRCIWRENGVWDFDAGGKPRLLRPDYFARCDGKQVSFSEDYYKPFANRFAAAIREVDPRAVIFIETDPSKEPPAWGPGDAGNIVYAPHWYDGMVLIKKEFSPYIAVDSVKHAPVFGAGAIRRMFAAELGNYRRWGLERLNGAPTLLAEFGIPFDMNAKDAYQTGNFRQQIRALDRSMQAIEANLLSCTLWNYSPDNSLRYGDQWNDEDLSIYCPEQRSNPEDINSGGRALLAAVRPYPRALAGVPRRMEFRLAERTFELEFGHDPAVSAPSEIFVPNLQYPNGYVVEVSDGEFEIDRAGQILIYRHTGEQEIHRIKIKPMR